MACVHHMHRDIATFLVFAIVAMCMCVLLSGIHVCTSYHCVINLYVLLVPPLLSSCILSVSHLVEVINMTSTT